MFMFCFQCEQTAGCKSCTGNSGVCGKSSATAQAQDELTGALISLAMSGSDRYNLFIDGLFATITNVNFSTERVSGITKIINLPPYDMSKIWNANEDIRSLKSLVLFGLRGMAAYAYHARVLGYRDEKIDKFFVRAMAALGNDKYGMDELLPLVMETGQVNLKCMALLDKANTKTYGNPSPVKVSTGIEKGPFIVVTGHDLKDLEHLLIQTRGKGINIYTHGEMLPAHAYPELRRYSHLKGNFGTAWQNQQKEFDAIPGALLFTTNCLMPPKASYIDRVFTTGPVEFDGVTHINGLKDFSPIIEKALELGGYDHDIPGGTLTTGFGHGAVLGVANAVVKAVKSGAIRHFFLVGGCDGARPGRSYYRDFVMKAPADTVILTLACGKFRFNDLDLGTIGGIPRLLDMGQCNDAYSAIQVALALADAFNCGVNDLPLSMVLSWYEQKAVCILLTLLSLGVKNIRLGPTLPAFISPNVLQYLVENFAIKPITTPEKDLADILG
ncbi:MAG: hydroxylamine reductase [Synergistaceae bacterium]|nr:hydroxylamine reductase [Synergistaceae bacterium]